MPDNWNILASLLGTPRPPEPPAAESTTDERTPAKAMESEPKSASQPRSFVEKMTDKISDFVRGEDESARAQRTGSKPAATSEPPVEDVLKALTSVQPPPKLPGFGVQREEESVPDDGFGRREAEIQSRERQLSAGREESPARQREERQRRGPQDAHPPRARRGSGFASGLGLDVADDEDLRGVNEALPVDDDGTISGENLTTQVLEPAARPDSNARRGAPSRERSDRSRPKRSDQRSGPPPRRESAFVDDSDDDDETDDLAGEARVEEEVLDSSTRTPSRRRRGRRGQRQRMSVGELDEVVESDMSDSEEEAPPMGVQAEATEGEQRGKRRRGGRGGRGRDRDREPSAEETPKGRSDSTRGPANPERGASRTPSVARNLDAVRHEPPPTKTSLWGDDDLDDELESFDRPEVDLFDDSEEVVSSRSDAPDEDEGPNAGRRRSRRGGRRRGRGGAGSRTESDSVQPSGRGSSSRSSADLDDEPVSEFDDDEDNDLLDDDLVSREGRSRRSQTRTDQAPRSGAQRGREESRARSESRPVSERADVESGSRSKPIPTWKEIVNLMVDGNLKNRGGGRGPRPSGGGGQSGGSRRR